MTAPAVVSYRDAIEAAGRLKAAADAERDQLAADRGPEAVALAASRPGGPSVDELEDLYRKLQGASRQARAA